MTRAEIWAAQAARDAAERAKRAQAERDARVWAEHYAEFERRRNERAGARAGQCEG